MTTAAQLIEYLQKLPPDTEIEILKESTSGHSSYVEYTSLVLDEGTNFIDFRDNPNVKPESSWYGKTLLELGDK